MHTAAWPRFLFLTRKRCCLWRWQTFMENVSPFPAHDNRRAVCRRVADGASWHFWRPIIFVLSGIFLIIEWLAVVNAGALNIGQVCTLLSGVWRVQKKGCAWLGATGVQPGQ